MGRPLFDELSEDLKKVVDPAKGKALMMIAKGMAPLPGPTLVSAWTFLSEDADATIRDAALHSLTTYPEKMMLPVLQTELPPWVLEFAGLRFEQNENLMEAVLLNETTPTAVFVEVAKRCSEKLTLLIANNQERLIEAPEIVKSLESNPHNLKSSTDRIRHFLQLAGIGIPGDAMKVLDDETLEAAAAKSQPGKPTPAATGIDEASDPGIPEAHVNSVLNEEQKNNLMKFIQGLGVGGKVKLAMKGNREARSLLIRDANKLVASSVLKSPRLTELEIHHFSTLKSLSDEVIRVISTNPMWTKSYQVKIGLCFNPKTPLQTSMSFIKFLHLRDLQKLARERNVPGPLQKASKELVSLKLR